MNDKFSRIKALVKKINPTSVETKEAVDKFLRLYLQMYDKC